MYVADFYNHRVQKFTEDGRFLREWGGPRSVARAGFVFRLASR